MKKGFCLLLAIVLALSFTACNAGSPTLAMLSSTPTTTVATKSPVASAAVKTESPSPAPTQSPTPASTPTPTLEPTAAPTPQPTVAFTPATALAEKIMKEKKWTSYKYANMVKEAVAITLANSTVYTPEQLAVKLRKNVDKILVVNKAGAWGYDPIKKTVSFDTVSATPEALVYVLTSCISGFSEYQKYRWGKIKGVPWCFGSSKSVYLGKRESNFRLMSGLEDFISSRNMPGAVVSNAGCNFNATMVTLHYYQDGNRGLPSEQGLSILFYYAAGSLEVETAFFGDKKASDSYKAEFKKRFGAKKLDALISMLDDISLYHGYTAGMSSQQQKDGMEKIKAYEEALLGLLETRLANLKTQEELKMFQNDLEQFVKFNIQIDEEDFTKSVNDRIASIQKMLSTKVFS